MSKNILLINPWIHDFAAYDFWLKPLGLLYLGGLLRQNGHRVSYIDCLDPYHPEMLSRGLKPRRHAYGRGKLFRQVIPKPDKLKFMPKNYCRYGILPEIFHDDLKKHKDADIVLTTSMMTYWYPGMCEAIKIIKEKLPHVPVVLGGKYATLCNEHAIIYSGADYVISGAGEIQILELLKMLFGEQPDYIVKEDDLDYFPCPAFDLIGKIGQLPITTSRGCPYRCSYCSSHILNKKFLRRDPAKVADEIERWQKKYGVVNFSFYDDALLINPDKMIIPLLEEIKKRNLTCQFHCPNGLHLREIDVELAKLLFTSGFKTIRFGFETADFQKQKETGGKVVSKELEDGVRHLKKAGYKTGDIGIYLLCGLPGQRASEVLESIDFVRKCGAKPMLAEYSPIPGTKMWPDAAASSPFDIQAEPLYHNNSLLPCRNDDFTYEAYVEIKAGLKKYL